MLEYKAMSTSMDSNLKLLADDSSKLVDVTHYRRDICFAVNTLSQYLVQSRWVHLVAAKHVMRYLKGTINFGLYYDNSHEYRLYGYTDADWVGSISDRKSKLGGCYSLGSAMISWFSRKQSSVALSIAETEYIAACSASCEAIWLWKLMPGLFNLELDTTMILCDNQSCIKMTQCSTIDRRT